MPLKFKAKTKDEIPADQQALYVERDGAWFLDVDGAVEKAKLDEFRTTNVSLLKQLEEHKQRFEGIDPDSVRKLAEEKRKLEEAQQLKAGEVERVLESRLKAATTPLEKQLAATSAERDALNARLSAIQIDQAVLTEATQRGLRPSALPDITARAREYFPPGERCSPGIRGGRPDSPHGQGWPHASDGRGVDGYASIRRAAPV